MFNRKFNHDEEKEMITYTGKMKIGGGGIGSTAWHQVRPLQKEGLIEAIYAPDIDKRKVKAPFHQSPTLQAEYNAQDAYFDSWVALNMEKYPTVLQTWMLHSLHTMQTYPEATKIVNLFSAHPMIQDALMRGAPSYNSNEMAIAKGTYELQLADHIIVPSEFVFNSLRQLELHNKAHIIPFGVDSKKFKPAPKKDDVFRVIFAGSNFIRKGLHLLVSAWHELNFKNAELVIMGVDEGWKTWLNPNNRPDIKVGWVDDVLETYQSGSVFCLPALEDGCPLVTYEAMACGLPPVVSETTGTYQHIMHGHNGFIAKRNSVPSIMEYLQALYDDETLVRKMGKNARKMIREFTWKRHEDEYLKVMKKIV